LSNNYSVVNLSISDCRAKTFSLTRFHDFSVGYCTKIANDMLYLAIVKLRLDDTTSLRQLSCTSVVLLAAEFVRQIQTSLKMACHN